MQQWQFINNFNQLNMFRAIVSPFLRSTRLCFLQLVVQCTDETAGWWHVTSLQSRAPEEGRNYRPKHVELIEVINKLSLLHLVWLFILLYYVQVLWPIFRIQFSSPSFMLHSSSSYSWLGLHVNYWWKNWFLNTPLWYLSVATGNRCLQGQHLLQARFVEFSRNIWGPRPGLTILGHEQWAVLFLYRVRLSAVVGPLHVSDFQNRQWIASYIIAF